MTDRLGPYELNTIVTGDARVLSRDLPDESVDLVLTDPPFGIGFQYSNGYKDDPEAYPALLQWIIAEGERIVKPGGLCFIYVAQLRLRHVLPLFPAQARIFAACKNFVQMRPTSVQYAYDPVVFWRKEGSPLRKPRGRDWHVGNTNPMTRRPIDDVNFHSCPRPLNTIIYMVENFSPAGGVVADLFMGSGTTALAAGLTGRNYWGCEIDPETADLARRRVAETQPPLPLAPAPEQGELL